MDQFGDERATYILRAVSGYSDEPVQASGFPQHCICVPEEKQSHGMLMLVT